jgi:hypothetical protein
MSKRRTEATASSSQPVALSKLLDEAAERLRPFHSRPACDGFLFAGNRHETVPRALFLDNRLTPLERNAWQVFRMLLNEDGVTAFPTYEQLRPYLACSPCAGNASDETIARALTLLRLARWLTLVRERRDPESGRRQGNLYLLHDEPLTPYEVVRLDPNYLNLVDHSLSHASAAVKRVGHFTLQELKQDPMLAARVLPSRLQVLAQHIADQGLAPTDETADLDASSETEDGDSSEKVALRIPKSTGTVRSTYSHKEIRIRNVPDGHDDANTLSHLKLPQALDRLPSKRRIAALTALQRVDIQLQQRVLDEWHSRCAENNIRDPASYLFGIIQRALRGELNALAGQRGQAGTRPTTATAHHPPTHNTPGSGRTIR